MRMKLDYKPLTLLGKACSSILSKTWWTLPIILMAYIFKQFYDGQLFPLPGSDLEQRGQYGDSFGVLNSLFTGLGFGGLVVTLILQQKQIAQQESEAKHQRQQERQRHYEATLYSLLALYSKTLEEVTSPKGDLCSRSVLRGSVDRAFEAKKKEKCHIIPVPTYARYRTAKLEEDDRFILDYLYFRNFKILSVEIDRQGRLVETLRVLLRHLVKKIPPGSDETTYYELVASQITAIEISYFFLVALTFSAEAELRDLLFRSNLLKRVATVKKMKIHVMMYEEFWGVSLDSTTKAALYLPISEKRIDRSIREHRKRTGEGAKRNHEVYASARVTGNGKATPNL